MGAKSIGQKLKQQQHSRNEAHALDRWDCRCVCVCVCGQTIIERICICAVCCYCPVPSRILVHCVLQALSFCSFFFFIQFARLQNLHALNDMQPKRRSCLLQHALLTPHRAQRTNRTGFYFGTHDCLLSIRCGVNDHETIQTKQLDICMQRCTECEWLAHGNTTATPLPLYRNAMPNEHFIPLLSGWLIFTCVWRRWDGDAERWWWCKKKRACIGDRGPSFLGPQTCWNIEWMAREQDRTNIIISHKCFDRVDRRMRGETRPIFKYIIIASMCFVHLSLWFEIELQLR